MCKIGFIITTFERDDLLKHTVNALRQFKLPNWEIIIVDQSPSEEKIHLYSDCNYTSIPHNSGLSFARNQGVKIANQIECSYCVIMADSICPLFDCIKINALLPSLETYDYIGLNLINRNQESYWIGKINLIPEKGFELEKIIVPEDGQIHPVEIIKNFFIAKTSTLLTHQWDEKLLLAEHEDYFWRAKLLNYKIGFIKLNVGKYIGKEITNLEYKKLRKQNWNQSLKLLKQKYSIKGWVIYK